MPGHRQQSEQQETEDKAGLLWCELPIDKFINDSIITVTYSLHLVMHPFSVKRV